MKTIPGEFVKKFGKIGMGCMALTGGYGAPLEEEKAVEVVVSAYSSGVRFFDTADVYGQNGSNEKILGKAFQNLILGQEGVKRSDFCVCTKVGHTPDFKGLDFSVNHLEEACGQSLLNLFGKDEAAYIDIYYLHRMPNTEERASVLNVLVELVKSKKIHYVGLSEPSIEFVQYAHDYFEKAVEEGKLTQNPLLAVQTEFSLFSQGPLLKDGLIEKCAKLKLIFVPYGSLCHGLLTTSLQKDATFDVEKGDIRGVFPRFQGKNFESNLSIRDLISAKLKTLDFSLENFAMAWSLIMTERKECSSILIPGTVNPARIAYNLNSILATQVRLNDHILQMIANIVPVGFRASGDRYPFPREIHNIPSTPPQQSFVFSQHSAGDDLSALPYLKI